MKINRLHYCEPEDIVKSRAASPCWSRIVGHSARILLLVITVCAIWLSIEKRWGSNFLYPTRYVGDSHYILGMMKLAKDGDLRLFSHITTESLGAPFVGQLNDWPQAERVIVWLGGQIAKVFGLIPAANIMLLFSSIVAACSFYSAACSQLFMRFSLKVSDLLTTWEWGSPDFFRFNSIAFGISRLLRNYHGRLFGLG